MPNCHNCDQIYGEVLKELKTRSETDHYSRLCRACGILTIAFRNEQACCDAVEELKHGDEKFRDWKHNPGQAQAFDCDKRVLRVRAWYEPKKTAVAFKQIVKRVKTDIDEQKVGHYKDLQRESEKNILYDPDKFQNFNKAVLCMSTRRKIPGMKGEEDPYNINIAFFWYHVFENALSDVLDTPNACVAEMGPHTPKGKFPTSQVLLGLSATRYQGTYYPLDYAEWPLMWLLGWHEWSRRKGLVAFNFADIGGTDWLRMGEEFKNRFDVLIASHIAEDFSFGRYFKAKGYDMVYPYDEMYHARHRAKVHWLRFVASYLSDDGNSLNHDLKCLAQQMRLVVRPGGHLTLWHYPAFRLLNTGLVEEAIFEMFLHHKLAAIVEESGWSRGVSVLHPELRDKNKILFFSAFRHLVRRGMRAPD